MFYGKIFKALNKARVKYTDHERMKTTRSRKSKNYEVYEHLEHYVRNTTYAHRLQMLEEMNKFVYSAKNGIRARKKLK